MISWKKNQNYILFSQDYILFCRINPWKWSKRTHYFGAEKFSLSFASPPDFTVRPNVLTPPESPPSVPTRPRPPLPLPRGLDHLPPCLGHAPVPSASAVAKLYFPGGRHRCGIGAAVHDESRGGRYRLRRFLLHRCNGDGRSEQSQIHLDVTKDIDGRSSGKQPGTEGTPGRRCRK